MKKTTVALVIAAVMAVAANPALAHCGGSHGKSYRAAQAKKPAATKEAAAKPGAQGATAAAPANQVGQPSVLASAAQSAVDGSGATF